MTPHSSSSNAATTITTDTVPPYVVMEVLPASHNHHRPQNHSNNSNCMSHHNKFSGRNSRINSLDSLSHSAMPFLLSPTFASNASANASASRVLSAAISSGFSTSPALTGLGFTSPSRPAFSAFDLSYPQSLRAYSDDTVSHTSNNNSSLFALDNTGFSDGANLQHLMDNSFLYSQAAVAASQPHNAFFNAPVVLDTLDVLAGPMPHLYNSHPMAYFSPLDNQQQQQHQLQLQNHHELPLYPYSYSYSCTHPESRSPVFLPSAPRSPIDQQRYDSFLLTQPSAKSSLASPTTPPRSPFNIHIAPSSIISSAQIVSEQQPQSQTQQQQPASQPRFILPGTRAAGIVKPPRFKPNENELALLTAVFVKNPYPSSAIRKKLAEKMGLEMKQ
ncbi:hypothetical protein HK100_003990, partial [Physocladia obscura]